MNVKKINESSVNYAASIVTISQVYDIEGADKIKRVVVHGNDVIVSSSTQSGTNMIYFQSGTQLSDDYCSFNNMYSDSSLNKDKGTKGYVSPKKRLIKALKLRGVISNGILMPVESLSYIDRFDSVDFYSGDSFTDINNIEICCKYEQPVNQDNNSKSNKTGANSRIKDLIPEGQFNFHYQTEHLAKNMHKLDLTKPCIVTRKFHGSSCIVSNTLVYRKLNILERVCKFLGADVKDKEYGYVWSSGKPKSRIPKGLDSKTNKWESSQPSFYSKNIWETKAKQVKDKVEKGISIYSELVGEGIQGAGYTYARKLDMIVYRITSTNVDGVVTEFTWDQVKDYCDKYELEYVQEYESSLIIENQEGFLCYLRMEYLDKSYPDCKNDEGVCVRQGNTILKFKSPKFILGEAKELDK